MLHREDGSAYHYPKDGSIWFLDGKVHREDVPIIEDIDGKKILVFKL